MGYINVDPITKKVKEYKNMAEWQADVEKATSDPKPKPIKKMTFAEASKKLREEAGIDLRDSSEKRQAEVDSLIEKKVAEGISAALARQQAQATQSPTLTYSQG
jgi:N-acetylmuramoyl-L-alanine amidase CwlA